MPRHHLPMRPSLNSSQPSSKGCRSLWLPCDTCSCNASAAGGHDTACAAQGYYKARLVPCCLVCKRFAAAMA